MIYCVIPCELESELFQRMTDYYRDNPDVEVILDRREGAANERRRGEPARPRRAPGIRDRRRARAAGTFPRTDAA